jgi:hypothetical protein
MKNTLNEEQRNLITSMEELKTQADYYFGDPRENKI